MINDLIKRNINSILGWIVELATALDPNANCTTEVIS